MGRLSEALRHAGQRGDSPVQSAAEPTNPFISPWAVDDSDSRPAPPAPVIPLPAPRPGQVEWMTSAPPASPMAIADRFKPEWANRLTVGRDVDPVFIEQFRRLAASLVQVQRADKVKSILVTSAVPGDGKTVTAVNLALVLSESYRRRVLLIDADLRRPAISEAMNLAGADVLAETINAAEDRRVGLIQLSETLTLLPAGRAGPDPLSGITSPRMSRLIEEAEARFDWVIIDSPPLGAVADAGLLCPMVDAAILVVRRASTPHAAIQRTVDTLGRDRILGIVLNGGDRKSMATSSKYAYEYGNGQGRDEAR
jgi:protein-tyrosine kinase